MLLRVYRGLGLAEGVGNWDIDQYWQPVVLGIMIRCWKMSLPGVVPWEYTEYPIYMLNDLPSSRLGPCRNNTTPQDLGRCIRIDRWAIYYLNL